MASEAKTTTRISELRRCFLSIDFQNMAKILMNIQQEVENEKDEILKENEKLKGLLKEKDVKIENLEKENDGLKEEVKKKQNEIGVYKKNLDVRVSSFEKKSGELLPSGEGKKAKNVVVAERSRTPPPGLEEILDPKPKKEKDSKVPEIIKIDDDDHHHLVGLEGKKAKNVVVAERSRTPPPGLEEILDPKPKKEKDSKVPEIIKIDDDDHHHLVGLEGKKAKNVVVAERSRTPPPGLEEILDPKPKKEKDSKVSEIINIDDDDDDDDDHGDRDLMKGSSKRKRDEIKSDEPNSYQQHSMNQRPNSYPVRSPAHLFPQIRPVGPMSSSQNPQYPMADIHRATFQATSQAPSIPPSIPTPGPSVTVASTGDQRGGSVDGSGEENWRPTGRMRGSLSGRSFSETLNPKIIRPNQPVQAARPPAAVNAPRPFIMPHLQALMANNIRSQGPQTGGSGPGSESSVAGSTAAADVLPDK